ncbi:MAG: sigma 54-interacting transcriptional regulator [Deltaproteobacteria bacterium]|nr:sigma 54-interacting transcriptional regulator [Deltaproteobacteria bacterium]
MIQDDATQTLTQAAGLRRDPPVPGVVVVFTAGVGPQLRGKAAAQPVVMGRSDEADLVLDDPKVSRRHAQVEATEGGVLVEDRGSHNGVFVDGVRIPTARAMAPVGATLRVGNSLLRVVADAVPYEHFAEPNDELVGGPALAAMRQVIRQVAPSEVPVMVIGESGVGKELVARSIHSQSGRAGMLVAVNCAALPSELIEAELFGHARGAFSGAGEARPGLARSAAGGTLMLDEIGEMPVQVQPKLLRVLETGLVRPVGQDTNVPVDFRLVSATNTELDSAIKEGSFRSDLYHRIAGLIIEAPPLRAHAEDIPKLLQHFLAADGHGTLQPSVEAVERLLAWHWPGNVRELRNVARSARVRLGGDELIRVHHLPKELHEVHANAPADDLRARLEAVLAETAGNVSEAARRLKMRRQGLYDQLQRLHIDPRAFRKR